jgi:hypothetical protein
MLQYGRVLCVAKCLAQADLPELHAASLESPGLGTLLHYLHCCLLPDAAGCYHAP